MSSFIHRGSIIVVVLACTVAACRKSDYYCPGALEDNCNNIDAGDGQSCTSTAECTAPQVCDVTDTMTCVQCTPAEDDACSGMTPACVNNACQGCTAHAQCTTSNVCLPDGSCADPAQVAYVQAGSSGNCDMGSPCGTMTLGIAKNRPYVKVATGMVNDATTTTISRAVTILANAGASVNVMADDVPVLSVSTASADVKIFDLEITGGTMAGGVGINVPTGGTPKLALTRAKVTSNQGGGISSTGGALTVTQSTFSGNQGGGISVMTGTFVIVGNVFFNNGNDTTLIGGVAVGTAQNAANRLEFNSFNLNKAVVGKGTAIDCLAGTFTARNNIMSGNGTLMNMEQVGGTCSHAYSIARPGTVPPGTGNSALDPLFANTTTGDLHLRAGSPALRTADPNSDLTGPAARDIDGDARVSPADIGADEAP